MEGSTQWRGSTLGRADSWGSTLGPMQRRLEQVAALVVAAGLAIVSYWLFFSWAQGGGKRPMPSSPPPVRARPVP